MKLTKKRIQEILSQYEPGANVYVSVSHEDIKALCNLALEREDYYTFSQFS